jgi:hypothetical protein
MAARLGELLGVTAVPIDGRPTLDLGAAVLEVVALSPGDPGDDRLRFGLGPAPDDGAPPGTGPAALRCVGLGLATVDTERFASQHGLQIAGAVPDLVLGARTSAVADGFAPVRLLILEPRTEGRVAASLARWGEGPAALYLTPAADLVAARDRVVTAGGRATPTAVGPFGRSFAVAGGHPWGPHLVIVGSDALTPLGGDSAPA